MGSIFLLGGRGNALSMTNMLFPYLTSQLCLLTCPYSSQQQNPLRETGKKICTHDTRKPITHYRICALNNVLPRRQAEIVLTCSCTVFIHVQSVNPRTRLSYSGGITSSPCCRKAHSGLLYSTLCSGNTHAEKYRAVRQFDALL